MIDERFLFLNLNKEVISAQAGRNVGIGFGAFHEEVLTRKYRYGATMHGQSGRRKRTI